MKIGELKQYLNTQSKEQLIAEIRDLFSKFDSVKDYYQSRFETETESAEVNAKYKRIIKDEFFPERGFGKGRLSVAKKGISDYKKVSTSEFGIADVMLYYVEIGVEYTVEFGDIDETFYNSMERMYASAVKYIDEREMQYQFEERCRKIVDDTSDIGWGFHDNLGDIYAEYFEDWLLSGDTLR